MNESKEGSCIPIRGRLSAPTQTIEGNSLPGRRCAGIGLAIVVSAFAGGCAQVPPGSGRERISEEPAEMQLQFAELLGEVGSNDYADFPHLAPRRTGCLSPLVSVDALGGGENAAVGVVP